MSLDLFADIIPGESAAGFLLGLSHREFASMVSDVKIWDQEEWQLGTAIEMTTGWLHRHSEENSADVFNIYYFGNGAVRLSFDERNQLSHIMLGKGYKGRVFGTIEIGDKLRLVCDNYIDLQYDPHDEVYYPARLSGVRGIEFYTSGSSLSLEPDQVIESIMIFHDQNK